MLYNLNINLIHLFHLKTTKGYSANEVTAYFFLNAIIRIIKENWHSYIIFTEVNADE